MKIKKTKNRKITKKQRKKIRIVLKKKNNEKSQNRKIIKL